MKRLFSVFAVAVMVLSILSPVFAAEKTEMEGWLVCGKCKKNNANEEGVECAKKCVKKGAPVVFYEPKTDKIYKISNQDMVKEHIGKVKIIATVSGDTLKVEKVEHMKMEKEKMEKK